LTIPRAGSVLQSDAGSVGHVARVIAVHAGTVFVEEYNYNVSHGYDIRAVSNLSGLEFIHFQDYAGW